MTAVEYIRFSELPAREQLVSIPMISITMCVSIRTRSSQWTVSKGIVVHSLCFGGDLITHIHHRIL